MGLGGGDVGAHGKDNDPGYGGGSAAGGVGSGGSIGMFGPLGLRGYKRVGNTIRFSHPSGWSQQERDAAKSSYTQNREPQNFWERASATMFGYNPVPPHLDPKKVDPAKAVSSYMGYLTKRRGFFGRISPTKEGVATDIGLNVLGGLAGPLAPEPVTAGLAATVNVISNYKDDKETAIKTLSEAGYSMKDIDASFRDYEAQLVSGLEGFGGGETSGEEMSDQDRQLAEALKAEQTGEEPMKTSTSDKPNTEEMRMARKKKTKTVFAGGLGSTGNNQVKKAKLLGQ